MTSFAIDAEWEFIENIDGPLFCLWHAGMTTHAFDVDFPIKMRVEILITWRQIPNSFLGVKSKWCLK